MIEWRNSFLFCVYFVLPRKIHTTTSISVPEKIYRHQKVELRRALFIYFSKLITIIRFGFSEKATWYSRSVKLHLDGFLFVYIGCCFVKRAERKLQRSYISHVTHLIVSRLAQTKRWQDIIVFQFETITVRVWYRFRGMLWYIMRTIFRCGRVHIRAKIYCIYIYICVMHDNWRVARWCLEQYAQTLIH